MDNRFIEVGDLKTFTMLKGDGSPVVLLHGMAATAECWTYTIGALTDSYHAIAPDLPGHGRSTGGFQRYGLRFYTEWLDSLLDTLGLPTVTLVGNSMGGAISLAYTMARPERVNGLMLVDALGLGSQLPYGSLHSIIASLPDYFKSVLTGRDDPYLLRFFQPWVHLDPWGASREPTLAMAALNRPHEWMTVWAGVRLLLADFFVGSKRQAFLAGQEQITVPTLITWGRHDGLIPLDNAYEGVERIPGAKLYIYENAAHEPMIETPHEFNAVLCDFLGRIASRERS